MTPTKSSQTASRPTTMLRRIRIDFLLWYVDCSSPNNSCFTLSEERSRRPVRPENENHMRHRDDFTFSRRTLLALATGAGVSVFCPVSAWAKSEFWNQKDPSQWTAEEINQILTKSPWAKQVDTQAQGQG